MSKKRVITKEEKKIFIRKWILIFFVASLIIFTFILKIQLTKYLNTITNNSNGSSFYFDGVYDKLWPLIIASQILSVFNFLMPLFLIKLLYAVRKHYVIKKNTTYISINELTYYRDLFKDLSPGMISFLVNLGVEYEKDISATLLRLEHQRFISFQNNKTIILENDLSVLKADEIELLNLLKKNIPLTKSTLATWETLVIETVKSKGYITEKSPASLTGNLFNKISFWSLLLFPFLPIILIINLRKISRYPIVSFERTAAGNEMTEKIAAMKNFIRDFSNLSEANKEQVLLWDEFLIYAVILEENTLVIDEIMALFKIKIPPIKVSI